MPGVTRNGDVAGGAISSSQSTVKANSINIIVHGDSVASHGDSPHNAATMIAGSNNVFIGGIAVVNTGDAATCGHTSNGSSDVNVGD
tara:strand:- start:574 stop:834 length:261 start_codon:yes stop_codon:yes gene_type:complete